MLYEHLRTGRDAEAMASEMLSLAGELYPICRSITGDGVRRSFDLLARWIPLQVHEVPSGTRVFDWEVPEEWNVEEAYVADAQNRRVVDFRRNSLHLVSYSIPVRKSLLLEDLQPHLHSLPEHPDWIPYRTSYYRRDWGFCLSHTDRERLKPGAYQVVIDARLEPGHLSYAEYILPGTTGLHGIVYAHSCHPSLANDNLSGLVVVAALAKAMRNERPRLTWHFVFGPGTIGSLTWMSRNEDWLGQVRTGLVLGLLGDSAPLTYKRSRRGDSVTDRAAELLLPQLAADARCVDFEPYGYDERQFCSPGFDLPVGRLTRSVQGGFAEYHTSADDLALLERGRIGESLQAAAVLVAALDADRAPINQSPKGEPRLGKRGLYSAVGGQSPKEFERALLWVLNQGDGTCTLVDTARRSGLPLELVERACAALEAAGLVRCPNDETMTPRSASR